MTYNPDVHHRHSIRLRDYDYASDGAYFVTLCTVDRGCYFAEYPRLHEILVNEWNYLPSRFTGMDLDEYVVMPNHLHGIIVMRRDTPGENPEISLGTVVGAFKSRCVTAWLKVIAAENINAAGKFWQRNYHEHIIRNEDELNRIRQYIVDNPIKWELDRENPTTGNQPPQSEKWMV